MVDGDPSKLKEFRKLTTLEYMETRQQKIKIAAAMKKGISSPGQHKQGDHSPTQ